MEGEKAQRHTFEPLGQGNLLVDPGKAPAWGPREKRRQPLGVVRTVQMPLGEQNFTGSPGLTPFTQEQTGLAESKNTISITENPQSVCTTLAYT